MKNNVVIDEYLNATKLGMPYTGRANSEKTLSTYGESLRRVERAIGKPLLQCGPTCGQTFLKNSQQLSQSTRNTSIVAAKGFFAWAIGNGYFKGANPFEHIRTKDVEKKLPVVLTHEEALRLLDCIEEAQRQKKDAALEKTNVANFAWTSIDWAEKYGLFFRVMYFAGLRIDEVLHLRKKDVLDEGIQVQGKGAKERFVPVQASLLAQLHQYIDMHPHTDYVFYGEGRTTYENRPMTVAAARRAFNEGVKLAGLPDTITPHKLRHSFATHVLESTKRIEIVQKLLGHENPATTLIYAKVRPTELISEYGKAFK